MNFRIIFKLILMALFCSSIVNCVLGGGENVLIKEISPNGRNTVRIIERRYVIESEIFLDASSSEFNFRQLIRTEDHFDDSYVEIAPNTKWVSENTLWLGSMFPQEVDKIVVQNISGSPIRYVLIESGFNRLVLFGLQPNERRTLSTSIEDKISVTAINEKKERSCVGLEVEKEGAKTNYDLKIAETKITVESKDRGLSRSRCGTYDRPSDSDS